MSNGKVMMFHLMVELIMKTLLYKMNYFPEPYSSSKNKIKLELDLYNDAKKIDLKNGAGVDTSK